MTTFAMVVEKLPDWFFTLIGILILIMIAIFVWWITLGVKRYGRVIDCEEKLLALNEDYRKEQKKADETIRMNTQLSNVIQHAQSFTHLVNTLRQSLFDQDKRQDQAHALLKRIMDTLPIDLTYQSEQKIRCALWIKEGNSLLLSYASGAVPPSWVIHTKKIDSAKSIPGRALSKKELTVKDRVNKDLNFEPNYENPDSFTAVICIPLQSWGVLTIESPEELNGEVLLIAKLYTSIIEGVMDSITI